MSGIYTRFVAGVIFPLQERLKGHTTVAVRTSLEESQWWPRERLEALQVERLRRLLIDAGRNVPYYRDLFTQIGLNPSTVSSTTDLQRLPFLTKAIIRKEGDRMKSEVARGLTRFNTGGSSGEPLIFYIGKERVSHDVAAKWRATRWWGVDIGDPEIVVWGSPIELGAQDRIRLLRDRVMRTDLLPAFEMSERRLDEFVEAIAQTRPAMLFGYPSSISLLALHAEKRGRRMKDLGIKVAFVTSERLYDHQREEISRVFGCPVANGYGGRDAGFIAHQCPQGGMHITTEDIVVEIVGNDGECLPASQPGEVVITHLATGDYPFIRYRTGDVAVLADRRCNCGRGLPLLEDIQGRTTDFVIATDGTVVHGLAVIYPIRDIPGISSFKVVRETRERILVQIVPDDRCAADVECRIAAGIKARLGQGVDVQVVRVSEVPREGSGKFRYVQSLIAGELRQ